MTSLLPVTVGTSYTTKNSTKKSAKIRDTNAACAAHFFLLVQPAAKYCERKYLLLQSLQAMTEGSTLQNETSWCFPSSLPPKKNARKKTHLEHDLEHKKLHAKRPIWSTIWSAKSCTRKHPSEARFEAQKVAREKNRSGARFEAQKVGKKHSKNPLFWKIKLCSVQFWWESKIVGNTRDQFFKLSIANCVEWLQWARRAGTVKKKTLQTNHEAPE